MEKGELVFEFDSLNQGETTFNFTYDYNGKDYMQSETQMTVGIFNILIYNSLGEVSFNGYMVLVYAIVVSFFAIMVVMFWIFVEHNKKGDFSHTMIASDASNWTPCMEEWDCTIMPGFKIVLSRSMTEGGSVICRPLPWPKRPA